ncbi:MAG: methyltransferase domain-containing protein [Syntrophomonadaceae bacterium]|jgi:23S rRNA (guanine745-N1)-methyltransferase|nr:methyltransferase domain-containing protein [Syntrophomonadaceae bacterium]
MEDKAKKKIDRARAMLINRPGFFHCPVCQSPMFVDANLNMACANGHNFDFSKKGSLNLLTAATSAAYPRDLFTARHQVLGAGFCDPLIQELARIIKIHAAGRINVLDAGCGEGSNLYNIYQAMGSIPGYFYVGADISKYSIQIAASNNADIIWCVADLARLPFSGQTFDFVLNILSPANYKEFHRILNQQGLVIKVVPGTNYLKELREIIYQDGKAAYYSNQEVISLFQHNLELLDMVKLNYTFTIDDELWPHFIKMTPLVWGSSADNLRRLLDSRLREITVDLILLTGAKKN